VTHAPLCQRANDYSASPESTDIPPPPPDLSARVVVHVLLGHTLGPWRRRSCIIPAFTWKPRLRPPRWCIPRKFSPISAAPRPPIAVPRRPTPSACCHCCRMDGQLFGSTKSWGGPMMEGASRLAEGRGRGLRTGRGGGEGTRRVDLRVHWLFGRR
jgi:hypothetical protein